jgi:hypothetical protein
MSDELKSKKIKLSLMHSYNSLDNELPENNNNIQVIENNKSYINILKESVAIWMGRSCTSCDNIYSYPNQLNNNNKSITFIRLEEWKSTNIFKDKNSNSNVRPSTIEDEKINAFNGIKSMIKNENDYEIKN